MTLLYIGNELLIHGKTPSSIDTLSPQLREFCDVITTSKKENPLWRLIDMLITIIRHRKEVDYMLIDTYSTNNFYFAYIAGRLAKYFNIEYFTYLHGGNLPSRLKSHPKLSRKLFHNSKMNLAPSGYLFDAFAKNNYKVEFIPNNIDIKIYPFREREYLSPKLLFVRSFSEVYNPYLAIKVFAKIKAKYTEASMCMVGPDKDGTLDKVKSLAKELGVLVNIEFTGKISKQEWIERSKEFDIFINPTNFDNQPVSILEAMALGFPIVSTNVGGLPYLIENGIDGILVEADNVEDFVNAIVNVLENSSLAHELSLCARKKAITYDWTSVSLKWKQLFNINEKKNNVT